MGPRRPPERNAQPEQLYARGGCNLSGAVKDVGSRASTLLKLLHEQMYPDEENRPEGLDLQVAAFGPNRDKLEGLVGETVVSALATSFVVLLGHGVPIDDAMVYSLPGYTTDQSARATRLARQLQLVVEADTRKPQGSV